MRRGGYPLESVMTFLHNHPAHPSEEGNEIPALKRAAVLEGAETVLS